MTNTAYTDMLAHDGEMWFSMLYRKDTGNGRFYFTIGDGTVTNNGNLSSPGQAIGFGSTGSRVFAGLWETFDWGTNNLSAPGASSVDVTGDSMVNNDDGGTLAATTTYLIVGHAEWGANGTADDSVTLYLPDTDLVLGSAVAKSVGVVDQSDFDLINTNHGNGLSSRWDEIRVGATYADVTPVPEPSSTAFLGLAGLALILRRRK
ncbi:MAG: PEP-CTERM sorting domain-containing protein [Akkermansiaceae bacterium]